MKLANFFAILTNLSLKLATFQALLAKIHRLLAELMQELAKPRFTRQFPRSTKSHRCF